MSFTPSHIATLATKAAIDDLRIFLKSLDFWNRDPPTVYLFCDAAVKAALPSMGYTGDIVTKEALNPYTALNRAQMERLPGVRNNLFFDFVCEKLNLLEWVFSTTKAKGVLFCDADICFLSPLFQIPRGTTVAVSPHHIREQDEAKYGVYNAGMLWLADSATVAQWRAACDTSTFYEQIAIEELVSRCEHVYKIPLTENYGWWRLYQGRQPTEELQREWSFNHKNQPGSGITVGGVPLGSVHTHFAETRDAATVSYNTWVLTMLRLSAKSNESARRFMDHLGWK
jgi:hypothetical protein